MQKSSKMVKAMNSNSMCMFPGTVCTRPHKYEGGGKVQKFVIIYLQLYPQKFKKCK